MKDPAERSVKKLRELVSEMHATLQRVKGQGIMRVSTQEKSIKVLKRKIIGLSHTIYDTTDDVYLKAVVNSVFDSMDVDAIIVELRNLNNGLRPTSYCSVDGDLS